jgi:hypothetical protein
MKSSKKNFIFIASLLLFTATGFAQYKEYKLNAKGDTINAVNKDGQKVGKWVIEAGELRGEPGYVEEGMYKKGEKNGFWRKYSTQGDLLSVENFINGGKEGLQQYFTFLGVLEREENWKGYDPEDPYDTIAVYGTGSGEIVDYKIVKAEPYSVKNGEWRYYDPENGRLLRTEQWSNNNLVNPNAPKVANKEYVKPQKTEKTPAMLEWERKNRGKRVISDGRTGL